MIDIIEAAKEVDIKEIIRHYGNIELDKHNQACCPFHGEKTASFSVPKNNQYFHCFGCGASGDGIKFVSMLLNISNFEAAKTIVRDLTSYNIEDRDNRIKPVKKEIKAYERVFKVSEATKNNYRRFM